MKNNSTLYILITFLALVIVSLLSTYISTTMPPIKIWDYKLNSWLSVCPPVMVLAVILLVNYKKK
jgi:hypothetical protein